MLSQSWGVKAVCPQKSDTDCFPVVLNKIFSVNLYNFHFVLKLLHGPFVFVCQAGNQGYAFKH